MSVEAGVDSSRNGIGFNTHEAVVVVGVGGQVGRAHMPGQCDVLLSFSIFLCLSLSVSLSFSLYVYIYRYIQIHVGFKM